MAYISCQHSPNHPTSFNEHHIPSQRPYICYTSPQTPQPPVHAPTPWSRHPRSVVPPQALVPPVHPRAVRHGGTRAEDVAPLSGGAQALLGAAARGAQVQGPEEVLAGGSGLQGGQGGELKGLGSINMLVGCESSDSRTEVRPGSSECVQCLTRHRNYDMLHVEETREEVAMDAVAFSSFLVTHSPSAAGNVHCSR